MAKPLFAQAMERIRDMMLSRSEQAMMLAAIYYVNFETGELWPTVSNWSRMAGLDDRTAQRALRSLSDRGVLARLDGQNGRHGTYYHAEALHFPAIDPRHSDTPVTVTPPSPCHPTPVTVSPHPRHRDTPPPSPCHPTPVTVTPNLPIHQAIDPAAAAGTSLSGGGRAANPAAAAAVIQSVGTETMSARIAALTRKPEWLPEGKPWIDERGARRIAQAAALDTLTQDDITKVMKAARDARNTLKSPAAFVISELLKLANERQEVTQ